jgi:hypothetical protein
MKAFITALLAIVVTAASAGAQIDSQALTKKEIDHRLETAAAIEHALDHRRSIKMDLRGKVIYSFV